MSLLSAVRKHSASWSQPGVDFEIFWEAFWHALVALLIPLLMSEPLLKKNEFLGAQGRTTSTLWNFAIRRDRASLSHCPLVPPFRAWEKPFPPRVPAHYHIWLYVRRPSILFMVLGITQHFVAPPMTSNVLLVCLVAYATATMITVADTAILTCARPCAPFSTSFA